MENKIGLESEWRDVCVRQRRMVRGRDQMRGERDRDLRPVFFPRFCAEDGITHAVSGIDIDVV